MKTIVVNNPEQLVAGSELDTPVWVVIPAAGRGLRLGGEVAKQYRLLDGTRMLDRTVQRLLQVPGVAGLVVVLAAGDPPWSELSTIDDPRIHTTTGGETRAQSVLAGIDFVGRRSDKRTWVMVHDAARPLVALSDIQRLVNSVYNTGAIGGLLASPVQDTLKRSDDYAGITETVQRADLWQAQTPQLFRVGELSQAMVNAMDANPELVTDEASAMEQAGHQPLLVEALQPNVKITRLVDWQVATALLQSHRSVADPAAGVADELT